MGIKYPTGESPVYPPRDWTCPHCLKYHSKPHYAHKKQIDYSKEPKEEGRVKFNREASQSDCDNCYKEDDVPRKFELPKTGDQFRGDDIQRPMFCPHCGWEDTIICIVKTHKKEKRRFGIFK